MYYALWVNYNLSLNSFSTGSVGATTQAAQDGLEQILKNIYKIIMPVYHLIRIETK